jgi:hypothetical protein
VPNQAKSGVSVKTKEGNWVWFNCGNGTFTFDKKTITPSNDTLKKSLTQNYCKKQEAKQNVGGSSAGGVSSGVVKPTETTLDLILQKIPVTTTPTNQTQTSPQGFDARPGGRCGL